MDVLPHSVRAAGEKDAARLAELSGELGYPVPVEASARRLARVIADPGHCVLVVERAGSVLGWAHVSEVRSLVDEPHAELLGLVVDGRHRGRGLGRALVLAAEAWARERGLARVRLRSRVEREAAHGFYRGLGYEVHKTQLAFAKRL